MNVANNLSILRVVLTPVFVTCLVYYGPGREWLLTAGLGIFLVACVTDALDGYLARRLGQQTVFGSYIDPLADKLLLVSGFVALTFMPNIPDAMRIPAWVTIPVITRDIVIVTGSTVVYLTTGRLKAQPLMTSKATTLFQMLTLLAALVSAARPVQTAFDVVTVVLTVVSGVQYLRMGNRLIQS